MAKKLTIRRGKQEDLSFLKRLFEETILEVCQADYSPQQLATWASGAQKSTLWQRILNEQILLVAEIEMKIVGFCTLENGNHVDFLYIHKDYQFRGIAKQLFESIEKQAIKTFSTVLSADVSKTAKPFFEKMGFEVVNPQTVVLDGVSFTNFKMKKQLL